MVVRNIGNTGADKPHRDVPERARGAELDSERDQAPVTQKQHRLGHSQPLPLTNVHLDVPMRLRVGHMLALFSVAHATLYRRMRAGQFPRPDGHDGRPYWKSSTIKPLLEK